MFALLMLVPMLLQPAVDAIVQDDIGAGAGSSVGDGPMAGSRANIYPNHPRMLVRDVAANGILSVAQLRARCQPATSWWTQCQRVVGAGAGIEREIPTFAMKYLLNGNAADADQVISLILAVDTSSTDLLLLSDVALGYDWVYNYTGFDASEKAQATDKLDLLALSVYNYISDRHIFGRYMGHVDSVGLAGIALSGHSPNATKYLDFALGNLTYMFEALQYLNGS